ncbi:DUF1161 domain-containing protein [Variovorax sp. J22R133]|uniref:DUF1161 domain-containing protein n=1 Tax=Variovorax brevis TaxID=3053503 RepID=UPI002575C1CF|nr:DUF1161 domain-containing protein [Variovorax sp. J22R133]MDM0115051.1 DUF1161 domain-containing protein [Variovorax sp. J22R133]
MKLTLVSLALLLLAGSASAASSCETLQSEIDAKIRSSGVTRFTLSTVDANASVGGKVVGTCEMGAKKIMYVASGEPTPAASGAPARAASPAPPPRPKKGAVVTECRDGTVLINADCKN